MKQSLWTALSVAIVLSSAEGADFDLDRDDHIAVIGNTLVERMQHDGWLEALWQTRFPEHNLVVRNLGFSGDELNLRLRHAGFGSPDEWLTRVQADVILACFGYNESFAGDDGLSGFQSELDEFVRHTLQQRYNGTTPPRLILCSPIAHEDLGNANLPDGRENNARLKRYTDAIREVAEEHGLAFVNLFAATQEAYADSDEPFTINGIHLNSEGNRIVAEAIDRQLFGGSPDRSTAQIEAVRAAVQDKNFFWFHRYRTTDGYSIHGSRADLSFVDGQTNRVVMQREMEVLDAMTANRDARIWAVARGDELTVDDSNTPEFLPVTTNKPGEGPNGAHLFLNGEDAIERMTVAKGLKVNLFADEAMFPELASPVQMAFDAAGRLWVAAWPSYPHWRPKDVMDDKLLIFEDTDHDGVADTCQTFAGGLHNPTGFEFWGGGVVVAQAPDLVFLKDTDGDDRADVRERILHGLDSADTHHTANSFTLGPGGGLYFQEGVFHHTQVETPYGPAERCVNAGVFRFEPRTRRFEVYVSYGFANPHGHVFDRWGQDFITDGTGNVNYYAAAFSGHLDYPDKHTGIDPYFQQRTRPCGGTEILSSSHFPEESQGNLLNANVIGFQGILQYHYHDDGAGFGATEVEPIVFSSDPSFRPVDIEVGPDGAIYIVDWQNPIIGHMQHNLRDPSRDKVHGRVYRITHASRPLVTPPKIAGEPVANLLDLLRSREDRVRYRVRIELSGRDTDDVIDGVNTWVASLDDSDPDYEHHLLEALWVHQHHRVAKEDLLRRVLASPDPRARAAATRVLCYQRDLYDDPLAMLAQSVEDEHPRVRLEAVRACSFFRDGRAAEVALLCLTHPRDHWIDYTLGETMRQLEPYWKQDIQEGRSLAADNPAGIDYLLGRVSPAELVKLPRTETVLTAMLSRDRIVHDDRHAALMELTRLHHTDMLQELLTAISRNDAQANNTAALHDLAHMLTGRPPAELRQIRNQLQTLADEGRQPFTRQVATVALATADGNLDGVWNERAHSVASLTSLLESIPLLPDRNLRAAAHERIKPLLSGLPPLLAAEVKNASPTSGRYVRIELPRRGTLTLAEVEVFSDGANIASGGTATQSSVAYNGPADRAIDGNTDGRYGAGGQTHTNENESNPWWELDLKSTQPIDAITVWNRSENNGQFAKRLDGFRISLLDAARQVVWSQDDVPAPAEHVRLELEGDPAGTLRRAAMLAIVTTGVDPKGVFEQLSVMIQADDDRDTAIRAISRIPANQWPASGASPLIDAIVEFVSALPSAERTSPAVRDALQLGSDLALHLSGTDAQAAARRTFRELGVPVIVLRPVPHQMIYDKSQIYVEAGRPVEIVLENVDIMPHNLLIVNPGTLEEIGIAGEKMATEPNAFERGFVPNSSDVLHATPLLQPRETARLQFTAPSTVGDYPYLCTFPGHWRRMRGVMHIVESLDDVPVEQLLAASASAVEVRPFVRAWTLADLTPDLEHIEHTGSVQRGRELFNSIACVKCHKMSGVGGNVGPDLYGVRGKLEKGETTPEAVLTELIDPSKVIADKYRTEVMALTDGTVVSGLVVEETDDTVTVAANPLERETAEPIRIPKSEIDERLPSRVSLMPQGLLNTLTREEIRDLLAYLFAGE